MARTRNPLNTWGSVGLWFILLILSVTITSLLLGGVKGFALIFYFTMLFAFPIWCLCVPIVIALKDAEESSILIILFNGILIGPASLALWCLGVQLSGGEVRMEFARTTLSWEAVLPP